ncbi:MAG TPA: aldo/keto reductase [Steroidobacteraceae bacterium]|jgi:aryl-alcohol dehydrogenase-like predicted oxidoreductase|nr:aldo/keto reductase [Steroidobacteraceae bacterium]
MSKLALGTVQFGGQYGVANVSGPVAQSEIAAILQQARHADIDTLDTAIAYGNSEASLGYAGVSTWRVISKLPSLPTDVSDVARWAETQVFGSLQRLKKTQLDGLLLHRSADLLGPRGKSVIEALAVLKSRGWIGCAGISIYDPAELDSVWPVWRPELVQAPCNVFDRRLQRTGWLTTLHRHGVRIHLRSVFLQGVLLMPAARRPAWFGRWQELFDRWREWCAKHDSSPLAVALAFARNLPGIERLVIGVDSAGQLQEVIGAAATVVPAPPEDLCSEDLELIEPSRWKVT